LTHPNHIKQIIYSNIKNQQPAELYNLHRNNPFAMEKCVNFIQMVGAWTLGCFSISEETGLTGLMSDQKLM